MCALPLEKQNEFTNPLFDQLMLHTRGGDNDFFLAVIISSWMTRNGALPQYLGLTHFDFEQLLIAHFPGIRINNKIRSDEVFDPERMPEMEDLLKLFHSYRANKSKSEIWISQIITAACLGSNHLWQDLGLWDRSQLSNLILVNFPSLFAKNNKNMKWKKFFYKQLCNEEGIYICRSPSCEVCAEFKECFGPE